MTGTATTTSAAKLSLQDGSLVSGRSSTVGDFDVRVVPADDVTTPLTGTLHLELTLRLRRRA